MGSHPSAMALVRPTPIVEIPSPPTIRRHPGPGSSNSSRPTPTRTPAPLRSSHDASIGPPQSSTSVTSSALAPAPAPASVTQSHDEPARQLRRTSYRRPLRVDWQQSIWAPLGSQPLPSRHVGWAGLTCPIAQPGAHDTPLPPPEPDVVGGDPTSGYFFIDNASMPQARNRPWGPTPLPPSTKRIKVSRYGNIHKAYHDINAALHVDEEYDNRAVRRAILRGIGATEEDLEREDRASTVGPQSGHINPNDDMDAISRRSTSIAATPVGPSGTPRRSHSRQLSMPANMSGDDDDDDGHGYPTIDPRIQHRSRVSVSPGDMSTQSHVSSAVQSRSVSVQPVVEAEGRAQSPGFFIAFDMPPAASPSTQPEPIEPVPPSTAAQAQPSSPSSSMLPPQSSGPSSRASPLASQPPQRIRTTRGSRLSAAAIKRLKGRPKREQQQRSLSLSPSQSTSPSPAEDDDDEDVLATRGQSASAHDSMDVEPLKFDLSGWGQPTRLSSLTRSAPSSARKKRVRLDTAPVDVDGDDDSDSDGGAVEEVQPVRLRKDKGKQKETAQAAPAWRVRLPSLDDSDDDYAGGRSNGNVRAMNGSGRPGSNVGKGSGSGNSGSTNSSSVGRQALLSHPWMARSSGEASRPVVEVPSGSTRRSDRPPPPPPPPSAPAPIRTSSRSSLFLSRSSSSSPDPLDDSQEARAKRSKAKQKAKGKGKASSIGISISGSQVDPISLDSDSD